MAGRGSAPGERRGGRTAGVPNKASIVKRLAFEALGTKAGKAAVREAFAVSTVSGSASVVKGERAIEALDKVQALFMGLAAKYQSRLDANGVETNKLANEEKFALYLQHAARTAASLAPYQDPTFKAVLTQQAQPRPAENGLDCTGIGSMLKRTQQDAAAVYARLVRAGP